MIKFLSCTFLLLATSLSFAGTTARVATWNIASGRSAHGGTPIPPDRIERIADVIATQIKPHLIVLEEVFPARAAADIARETTKKGLELVPVQIPTQSHGVVQLISLLKRPGVEVSDVELIKNSDDLVDGHDPEEETTRKAVLAKVKIDHFDFYLVGVHLKSKRPSKTLAVTPLEMRDRQCKVIADRLHELTTGGKEKDILLVGDYNMTPEVEADAGETSDAKNFETLDSHHELRILSSEEKGPTHVGFFERHLRRSKLDGFAIAHATEKEYVPGSFHVLNDKRISLNYKQFTDQRSSDFLSDHFPVVAEFDTTEDDD